MPKVEGVGTLGFQRQFQSGFVFFFFFLFSLKNLRRDPGQPTVLVCL